MPINKEKRGRNTGLPGKGPPLLIPLNQQSWAQELCQFCSLPQGYHSRSVVKTHKAAGRRLWASETETSFSLQLGHCQVCALGPVSLPLLADDKIGRTVTFLGSCKARCRSVLTTKKGFPNKWLVEMFSRKASYRLEGASALSHCPHSLVLSPGCIHSEPRPPQYEWGLWPHLDSFPLPTVLSGRVRTLSIGIALRNLDLRG